MDSTASSSSAIVAAARSPWADRKVGVRAAWIGWALVCLLAALKTVVAVWDSPVNRSYSNGAKLWWMQEDLYDGSGTGFIYLPQSAVLQLPFIFLPGPVHDFAWRVVTIGLFAFGVWKLSRLGDRHAPESALKKGDRHRPILRFSKATQAAPEPVPVFQRPAVTIFPLVTLLTLPKTWTVAVNGQATPAMAGLMMLAMAAVSQRRWWQGVTALLFALAFKPLAIVLVLLAGALYSPLRWRLAVGMAVFLAVPFLTQDPQYVIHQYAGFVGNLRDSAEVGHSTDWPQLFSLLQVGGIELSEHARMLTQAITGLMTLAAAWYACRTFPAREAGLLIYSLSATYLLLLNPRTENNTYSMLVPAIAVIAARDLFVTRRKGWAWFHFGLVGALTCGFEICKVFFPGAPFVWPCVLGAMAFAGALGVTILRGPIRGNVDEDPARIQTSEASAPTHWRAA